MHHLSQRRGVERVCFYAERLACLATRSGTTQHVLSATTVQMGSSSNDHERFTALALIAILLLGKGRLLREEQRHA
jgi:hypothetical protein